jgi:hypothetical protein
MIAILRGLSRTSSQVSRQLLTKGLPPDNNSDFKIDVYVHMNKCLNDIKKSLENVHLDVKTY